ncbi:MAG: hypothetical protein GJU73_09190 [Ferrovum sp.]|jgi:predicted HTH transcriptional regulator|nr:hypothetical protein [Ferrovum sp.]
MSYYNDAQFEAMMADMESDRAERKQSFQGDAPQKVREAVCALANDLAGHGEPGVVLIGVHDNGTPMPGFVVTDELLRSLPDIKTDGNIVPPPTLLVEKRLLQGGEVAVITVWPCDTPPVRYKGRIHVRWGPRRGLASAQDERILNERRRHRDRPFDIQPIVDATLDDLDRLRFEQEYLPSVVARDVLVANERTHEQRLAATKMVVSESISVPTVLGLLVVGKSPADWLPGAYTHFCASPAKTSRSQLSTRSPFMARWPTKSGAWKRNSKPIISVECSLLTCQWRHRLKRIPWMPGGSWCEMPSCTAVMRQRMRPCGCTGSMTASKSTTPAARLAASRQKISVNQA